MDNQAYLDKISASNRPVRASGKDLFSSPIIKIALGGIIAIIVIIIFGSVLGGLTGKIKDKTIALHYHIDNTVFIVTEFQPSLKSSSLRSASATLRSLLDSASTTITNFIVEEYKFDTRKGDKKIQADEEELYNELYEELFNAKINGLLDRTYARKIAYEITIIQNNLSEIYSKTKDENLKSSLSTTFDSLSNLYSSFDTFDK